MDNSQSRKAQLKSIVQPYEFKIQSLLVASWKQIPGLKGTFWLGVITLLGLLLVRKGVEQVLSGIPLLPLLVSLSLNFLLFYPIVAGLWLIAIRHINRQPIEYRMIFECLTWLKIRELFLQQIWLFLLYFSLVVICVAVAILSGALRSTYELSMNISLAITVIAALCALIYIFFSYYMTTPLIAVKGLSAWNALTVSRLAVNRHWFKIFFTNIIVLLIGLLMTLVTLGIGLIWFIPWAAIVNSNLYVLMFGPLSSGSAERT